MSEEARFAFGQNWREFLKNVRMDEALQKATEHSRNFLGLSSMEGKRFLDLGSGSGLFSLAALRMGAQEVVSVDIDADSIACATYLREQEGNPERWKVIHGSALDEPFMTSLGSFDVVYSWGVLHHTGDMAKALNQAALRVAPGGWFYVAIYNRATPPLPNILGRSSVWTRLKRAYVKGGPVTKKLLIWMEAIHQFLLFTTRGQNFFKFVRTYSNNRGMNWYRNVVDWVGGYPYEAATPGELFELLKPHNMMLLNVFTTDGLGCHEFLYRKPARDPFIPE